MTHQTITVHNESQQTNATKGNRTAYPDALGAIEHGIGKTVALNTKKEITVTIK